MDRGFGGGSFGGGGSSGFGGGSGGSSGGSDIGFHDDYNHHNNNNGGNGGNKEGSFAFFIIIGILAIISIVSDFNFESAPSVSESTIQRNALPFDSTDNEVGYSLWNGKSEDKLINGMNSFYEETGIVPYVYYVYAKRTISMGNSNKVYIEGFGYIEISISEELDDRYYYIDSMPTSTEAEKLAEKLYNKMFDDEKHMLVLHIKDYYSNTSSSETQIWYYCGEDASTVFDSQAGDIFMDYIAFYRYENNNSLNQQVLGNSFASTASRIMGPPSYKRLIITVCAIVLVVALITVFIVYKRRKKLLLTDNSSTDNTDNNFISL